MNFIVGGLLLARLDENDLVEANLSTVRHLCFVLYNRTCYSVLCFACFVVELGVSS